MRRRLLPGIPFAGMGRMHVVNRQADANPIVNEAGSVGNARAMLELEQIMWVTIAQAHTEGSWMSWNVGRDHVLIELT